PPRPPAGAGGARRLPGHGRVAGLRGRLPPGGPGPGALRADRRRSHQRARPADAAAARGAAPARRAPLRGDPAMRLDAQEPAGAPRGDRLNALLVVLIALCSLPALGLAWV